MVGRVFSISAPSEQVNKQASTGSNQRNPHQIMTCSQLNGHALQKRPSCSPGTTSFVEAEKLCRTHLANVGGASATKKAAAPSIETAPLHNNLDIAAF
jgi:hypothetical protein